MSEQSKQLDSLQKSLPPFGVICKTISSTAQFEVIILVCVKELFPRDLLMHGVPFMGAAVNVKAFVEMRRRGLS